MGGEKKEPLKFRICLGGDHRGHKKRAEHEDPLLCDDPCHFGGGNLSDCRMEVVYLLLFVRSGYVAGNRKYCSGSRCGSCDRRAETACETGERCGGRRSSSCGDNGSDRRADPVSPGGTGIFVYGP